MAGPGGDHIFASADPDPLHAAVAATLRRAQPWQSTDAQRYDLVERVRLWRHLTGDPTYDVDHYLTRLDRPGADSSDSGRSGIDG